MFENFIPAHSLEDENRLAEIRDVLPGRNQAIPSTRTNKHCCKHIPAPDHLDKLLAHLQCFVQRAKKYVYSVHCLVN